MPIFTYQARRATGERVSGDLSARDRGELKARLASDGLLLVEATAHRRQLGEILRPARVGLPQLLAFIREFRHLVDAGLPVARCLEILKDRPDAPALSAAIAEVHAGVARGMPLDKAAAERGDVFDPVFQSALRAGVQTSQLGHALERLESFLTVRAELSRKVRKAMAYPVFLLVLLVVVLAVLMLFVLPRFADLYAEFGSDLPAATAALMAAVRTAPVWVPLGLALLLLAGLGWRRARRGGASRRFLDGLALRLPYVGTILRDIQLVQLSYMSAMLLRAGTPLRDTLEFVSGSVTNVVMREKVDRVAAQVTTGKSFTQAALEADLYPPLTLNMIRAGEASGALPDLMEAVAGVHEQTVDDRMARLLALVEPVMMLLVGIVLGAVIITVYLPVFGISGVVQ